MGEKEWKEHADRIRRANSIMMWWCRFFATLVVLAMLSNTVERDLFWASFDMIVLCMHLYYLDKFRQWRDAAYE